MFGQFNLNKILGLIFFFFSPTWSSSLMIYKKLYNIYQNTVGFTLIWTPVQEHMTLVSAVIEFYDIMNASLNLLKMIITTSVTNLSLT